MVPGMKDRKGDFGTLYRRWWRTAHDAAVALLGSRDEAEDAAQRVFLRLWASGTWDGIASPGRYFREAGRREALTFLRQRRRWGDPGSHRDVFELIEDPGMRPDQRVLQAEQRAILTRAIGMLPRRCGVVCALVYVHGHAVREVSERLRISMKAVEKQLTRGRRRLRELLPSSIGPVSSAGDGGGVGYRVRLSGW